MQCPECQFDNPEGMKFCGGCGSALLLICSKCNFTNPSGFKFCGECGCELSVTPTIILPDQENVGDATRAEDYADDATCSALDSERKCVTVMFSDITGYTEMSEKLDPEEVKEITSAIFSELTKIIEKYDGFVEKYIGDAILAVFGAKEAFEDSALRAIKAAREIHKYVQVVSPKYEDVIGRKLSMHTGINTGLVVTGEINYQKGTHGLVGDTINTAARLMSASQPGEIITDHDSFVQTKGYFEFVALEPARVKGKADPIKIYSVGDALQTPKKLHRLHGLRAELIGRSIEIQILKDAAELLEQGQGSVISVCGTAGTGKSRLVHEFKESLDLERFQWFDGNAYPYTQNIPYFPLADLFTKAFGIIESDDSEVIKKKVELGLEGLLGKEFDKVPYIGSLFSIKYNETNEVSPEYWKDQLYKAVEDVLKALISSGPTVICLEDIHWVDPSTMDLIRIIVSNISDPLIVILIYRPIVTIFTDFEIQNIDMEYSELRLKELSPSESQHMVCSLLDADQIPKELSRFIRDNIDGNPFYVEELVNSLVDSETLSFASGQWVLKKNINESLISTNIQGVVTGRIDRLGNDTKRILQEASVIGRAFLVDILQRISEIKKDIDKNLVMLERIDLISARSIQPSLEYIFKHAITQEIVYNGLVKPEREQIHKKIGNVIEIMFQDRLAEFYETLAFHYERSQLFDRAIYYLILSGKKSLERYAVREAHQYFKKAYDIFLSKNKLTEADKPLLMDLLNCWGYSFYYLGEIKKFIEIFKFHQKLASSLDDPSSSGMFYAWLGVAHHMDGKEKESYEYLLISLELGEKAEDFKVIGYACTWLTWACAGLGRFSEGIKYGTNAQQISNQFKTDQYLYFKSLSGLCLIHCYQGEYQKAFEEAKCLLEYGKRTSNSRSIMFGHWMNALGHLLTGDVKTARKYSVESMRVAFDPFFEQFPKNILGTAYLFDGQLNKAEEVFLSALEFSEKRGIGSLTKFCKCFLAPTLIAKGEMQKGLELLKITQKTMMKSGGMVHYALSEYVLGEVYLQIATGPKPSLPIMAKNIIFLFKNVPLAGKNAEEHFYRAIELFKKMEMKGYLGVAYLSMGLLYRARKRTEEAKRYIADAINLFQECEAQRYLEQANEALESISVADM